jgi:hypothetical protein
VLPTFPLGPFTPYRDNPILRPQGKRWESANLYNPAAIVVGDDVVVLYRAHGPDLRSRIGLATSSDGFHFEREAEPVVVPEHDFEARGCEDPRISQVGDSFYLTYTGYDGTSAQLCVATSTDLRSWDKRGPMVPGFNSWGHAALRARQAMVKGWGDRSRADRGSLLHVLRRGSDLLRHVSGPHPLDAGPGRRADPPTDAGEMGRHPRRDRGPAGDHGGWGDGVPDQRGHSHLSRRCGLPLRADRHRPLQPDRGHRLHLGALAQTTEERHGLVSNVTFVEGLVQFDGRWLAYYGQSDTTLAVAVFDPTEASFRADR